jgi:hypothetical protein
MPGSIVVTLVALGFLLVANLAKTATVLMSADPAAGPQALLPLAVGVLVMTGLARRNRLAWQYGRVLVGFGAVMMTLVVVRMAIDAWSQAASTGNPSELRTVMLAMAFGALLGLVPLWAVFLSLGTKESRRWFGLCCPKCHGLRVGAADFVFRTCRCRACGHQWTPEYARPIGGEDQPAA